MLDFTRGKKRLDSVDPLHDLLYLTIPYYTLLYISSYYYTLVLA